MPRNELFIGSLPRDVQRRDIESAFDKYGRIERCDIKNRGEGAVYAFLEFEDERDAEDALRAENGKDMLGSAMVVEYAKGKERRGDDRRGGRFDDRRGGDDRYGGRGGRGGFGGPPGRSLECYECGERGHFARDCRNRRGSGRNDMSRRDDRGSRGGDDRRGSDRRRHSRSYSRSRSNSPAPRRRSPSPRRSESPRRRD